MTAKLDGGRLKRMRVLVAYSSKRGSTAGIAEAIADTIGDAGIEADCRGVDGVRSLDRYGAVVLGSAVYMKHWRGDARHFLRKFRKPLAELPLWVFSSGPIGHPDQDQAGWDEPSRIASLAVRLGARDHAVFGGRLPEHPRGPIERAMVVGTPIEYRDRRDWDEIRRWALEVAAALRQPATSPAPSV